MATNDPSFFEYTLKDTTFAAVSLAGARFEFSNRLNGHTYNPNGESSTGRGSSAYPVFHTGVIYEPTVGFTIPIDEADRFDEWFNAFCANDGVCHFERKRSKKRVNTVVDMLKNALPIRGEEAFAEGDATMIEYSANTVGEPDRDITGSITA
jgi:hypothetical protein